MRVKTVTPPAHSGTEERIAWIAARVAKARERGWLWADEPHLLVGWTEELLAELAKWRPVQTGLSVAA